MNQPCTIGFATRRERILLQILSAVSEYNLIVRNHNFAVAGLPIDKRYGRQTGYIVNLGRALVAELLIAIPPEAKSLGSGEYSMRYLDQQRIIVHVEMSEKPSRTVYFAAHDGWHKRFEGYDESHISPIPTVEDWIKFLAWVPRLFDLHIPWLTTEI